MSSTHGGGWSCEFECDANDLPFDYLTMRSVVAFDDSRADKGVNFLAQELKVEQRKEGKGEIYLSVDSGSKR